ncbi:MAG: hypothetical protein PVJ86_10155 [Phycisphaerales bacterium]|jgi:hypothetical protein
MGDEERANTGCRRHGRSRDTTDVYDYESHSGEDLQLIDQRKSEFLKAGLYSCLVKVESLVFKTSSKLIGFARDQRCNGVRFQVSGVGKQSIGYVGPASTRLSSSQAVPAGFRRARRPALLVLVLVLILDST